MNIQYKILSVVFAAFILTAFVPDGMAEEDLPLYFKHGAWLCTSPEAYDRAIVAQRSLSGGRTFDDLRQELLDQKECFYIEEEQRHDVISPYISVIESVGDMRKIKFFMSFETRYAARHQDVNWYDFTVWTHADNLKPLW